MFLVDKKLREKQKIENQNIPKTEKKKESRNQRISKEIDNNKQNDINKTYKSNNKNNSSKKTNLSINNILNKKVKFIPNSSFHNLLSSRAFRKFLNNKLEQSIKFQNEISKKFIENLPIRRNNNNNTIRDKKQNSNNDTLTSINYSMFYNEEAYDIPLIKNFRRTINTQYCSPNLNNININFNNRYSNDISVPQYNNLNDNISKQEQYRFTAGTYNYSNNNISDLTLKNQELHDKIIELQNEIRTSKNEMNKKDSELQKYFSSFDKMTLENNLNKEKIDELKKEIKFQKGAMNEKQNKISELENINNTLKNEMTKLQKSFDVESTMNKETKQNYEQIKANYNNIKNQYDILNIKYQSLSDENFNFKRDKALYERQIKTKNKMIESLIENKSNILNNKLYKLDFIEENDESNHEMYLEYMKNKNIIDEKYKKKEIDNGMKKNSDENNGIKETDKEEIDYTKFDRLTYPELQSKRDELVTERKYLNNILSKIPLKSNYKGQIQKRNELEKNLQEINCDLAIIKLRMKNLKS